MVSLSADEILLMANPAKYQGTEGELYLTSKKVAFDYLARGVYFVGAHSAVTLPLESISSASVVGFGQLKRLAINIDVDFGSFGTPKHEFRVENPEEWKERIELAKRTLEESV